MLPLYWESAVATTLLDLTYHCTGQMPVPASRNGNRSVFPVLPHRLSRRVSRLSLHTLAEFSRRRNSQPSPAVSDLVPTGILPGNPPFPDSDDVWTFWNGLITRKSSLLHDRNLGLKQWRAFLQGSHSVDRWLLGLLSFCGIGYLRYATLVRFPSLLVFAAEIWNRNYSLSWASCVPWTVFWIGVESRVTTEWNLRVAPLRQEVIFSSQTPAACGPPYLGWCIALPLLVSVNVLFFPVLLPVWRYRGKTTHQSISPVHSLHFIPLSLRSLSPYSTHRLLYKKERIGLPHPLRKTSCHRDTVKGI